MIESILIFSRSTPHHHTGGMETLAWRLAAEWAKAVPEVRIVTTSIPGRSEPFTEDGVVVTPLGGTRPGRYSRAWWDESRAHWRSLTAAPSLVFSVSAGAYSVVRERARHPETPFVLQVHGTSVMELGSKLRAPTARSLAGTPKNALSLVRDLARYRDFDRLVAVGENVVESLAARPQNWSATPDKVRLIPNGVRAEDHAFDVEARRRIRRLLGFDEETVVVGCVGRLHVQKRVDRALYAAAALRDRGLGGRFRFLVVGDGPDGGRLRGLARKLQLEDMVLFTGRVDADDVRDYYSATDVSLLTTARLEGLPMAVLEALACGLPCVVTAGSIRSEALNRVLHEVDPTDTGALADVVQKVTRERAPRTNLLPPNFLLDQCARDYLTDFAHLIALSRS
ncbi:glycosyltransferase family 4 protein [Micromonospora sp. NPDC047620]|uniref:glycosyltransferase family 4 protein n=1 Tax=Micromonospora sp. NPDC047620 TaxID=3364251 RepID=UPI00372075F6